jgi:arabinogalactan endo-1,4-beta-galactosidase
MVQIGNEIASGFLWNNEYVPTNQVNNSTVGGSNTGYPWTGGSNNTGFDRLATLLAAGIKGARDGADPGEAPDVMIHHDQGADWGATSYYLNKLLPRLQDKGADVDVLGYSYYPLYHEGGIAAVQQNLNNTVAAYNKPVVVVEAGFPSRNPQSDEMDFEFPVTPAGQKAYLDALVGAVQNVPNDMGRGVFWWFAEARPSAGLTVWESGRYGLFDQTGALLPAIDAFAGLNPSPPGDYDGDGDIDGEDLIAWQSAFGQTGSGLWSDGDADGDVDGADLLFWQIQLPAAAPAFAAVPEPATLFLTAATFAVLRMHHRGRRLRTH